MLDWGFRLPTEVDTWRVICYVFEGVMDILVIFLTIYVLYSLPSRTNYHRNLRITAVNMYVTVCVISVTRIFKLYDILSGSDPNIEKVREAFRQLDRIMTYGSCTIQLPSIFERIMATVKYREYNSSSPAFCVCVILASWVFVGLLTFGIVHFTAMEALIVFACADAGFLIVYYLLFKINYSRYKRQVYQQNLGIRYQVSENVKSLPAILWIVCTEIVYNVASTVFTFLMAVYVLPTSDKGMYAILDAVYNLVRAGLFGIYCFPFLFYSPSRRRVQFMNMVDHEKKNDDELYFKHLSNQWK